MRSMDIQAVLPAVGSGAFHFMRVQSFRFAGAFFARFLFIMLFIRWRHSGMHTYLWAYRSRLHNSFGRESNGSLHAGAGLRTVGAQGRYVLASRGSAHKAPYSVHSCTRDTCAPTFPAKRHAGSGHSHADAGVRAVGARTVPLPQLQRLLQHGREADRNQGIQGVALFPRALSLQLVCRGLGMPCSKRTQRCAWRVLSRA